MVTRVLRSASMILSVQHHARIQLLYLAFPRAMEPRRDPAISLRDRTCTYHSDFMKPIVLTTSQISSHCHTFRLLSIPSSYTNYVPQSTTTMPWLPTPSRPTPASALYDLRPVNQVVSIFTAILLFLIVFGLFVAMPVIIQFAPKPEPGAWVPEGIKCDGRGEVMRCWVEGKTWRRGD
jgi:hypothetical protein